MKRYELIEKIKLITSCTESCAEDVLDIFLEEPEYHIRSPDNLIQIDTIIRLIESVQN